MLKKILPAPILGIISLFLYTLTMLFWTFLIYFIALFLLIPIKSWRKKVKQFLHRFPEYVTDSFKFIIKFTIDFNWDVQGLENLSNDEWYLMISNHRSWLDIIVLQKVFSRKIPSLRFFMKKELLWQLPFAGVACWLLDYPFMQRYSKAFLEKNPQLKGKDIETTRKACEKFKDIPITMINYVEGGRFSEEKYKNQKSPYRYLLKPKAGGIAFVLETMGDFLHKILNVTIIYPNMKVSFWDFLCGRINKVIVRVEQHPISKELRGNYHNDDHFRSYFQYWLNELWTEKDSLIAKTLKENACQSKEASASATKLPI